MITAAYVPLPNYHALFPDALRTVQLLMPSTQAVPAGGAPPMGGLAAGLAPGMPGMPVAGMGFQ